ncbi:MAG: UvrD-helicase domain-containing protein [Sulfuricaulis sp.]
MSDTDVADALRSDARLVLVEAPAGCGKTYQGAHYAASILPQLSPGRLLVLTHTNAACDVFAAGTKGFSNRVEIRTIDSLIVQIASIYHRAIGLPADVPAWARRQGSDGFNDVAVKVADLLQRAPTVSASLAARYTVVVCDEHQDASEAQNRIILSIHGAGAPVRIFGDPMQAIYTRKQDAGAWNARWTALQMIADRQVVLDVPHRWKKGSPKLGNWINNARAALKDGGQIDLSGSLPKELTVIHADNTAMRHGQYMTTKADRGAIDRFVDEPTHLLVLTSTNEMVRGLRAFFYRRIPIWEGHVRDALSTLVISCQQHRGNAVRIAHAFTEFVQEVATGFTSSSYGKIVQEEVAEGCTGKRSKKPAKIQALTRLIVETPDHRGVARALARLAELISTDDAFNDIRVDLWREFRDGARLERYDDADTGMAEITLRRTVSRISMPDKAISTVHKAKGLERESVLILPCDNMHFPDNNAKRRLLYVALSRATNSLAIVLPRNQSNALFRV